MERFCLIPHSKTLAKAVNEFIFMGIWSMHTDTQPQPDVYRKAKNLFIMIQLAVYN